MYGPRTIIESRVKERNYATNIGLPNTEVDEIVIDHWFHLEGMDTNQYWMRIGGLAVNVQVDGKTGCAKSVMWELDAPDDGVEYSGEGA
jgi:hypothetical protein